MLESLYKSLKHPCVSGVRLNINAAGVVLFLILIGRSRSRGAGPED